MEPLQPKDVTVLWHGWLKKLGRFSKRWRRRYFVFLSTANGIKELRHYDAQKDVTALIASTPKGVIALTDATGMCCFVPPPPLPAGTATRKHTMFNRSESHDAGNVDVLDQKFAILTPLHVHMLAFQNGREWANASESQQGLSLLASLSAFYPAVEVLHAGYMSKKRERTVHGPKSIISYWKRHYFVFLSSGDLLYFREDTLGEFQGRVDVRHAPTVRVTGERMLEEKKKEIGVLKFAKLPATFERENCLVWIATPPSKMFVLKLQEDHEGVTADGKRHELTQAAKKWLSLLLQGHAETKYSQLEQCISMGKYDASPEIVSAVRAGIPDELRGQLWSGFAGATDLQRRAELKRSTRKASKTTNIRELSSKDPISKTDAPGVRIAGFFDELSGPLEGSMLQSADNQMIFSRLCVIAMREIQMGTASEGGLIDRGKQSISNASSANDRLSLPETRGLPVDNGIDPVDSSRFSDSDHVVGETKRNSLKQVGKGKFGHYVYPSDAPAPEWEISARRRLLIATTRFNPYSHPCPWRVSCLLLAYLDEENAFWMINSIIDVLLPGYYHGYRPALQVDVAAFDNILEDRAPTLYAHLKSLDYPIEQTVERWFLSLFTSTLIPLPTVLRIWDAFFVQGVRIFFGVGIALLLKAEDKIYRTTSAQEIVDVLSTTERNSIDADALFSHVFKEDLNIPWLSEERFEKIRSGHRHRVIDSVTQNVDHFKEKLSILSQLQDHFSRSISMVRRLLASIGSTDSFGSSMSHPSFGPGFDEIDDEGFHSLELSLRTTHESLKQAMDRATKLALELNRRQAKWLALSSQLAACPLACGPGSDQQSWLTQVREGKISGAGLDALHGQYDLGVLSVTAMIEKSEMFFEGDELRAGPNGWSCLMTNREDFSLSHRFTTETFLFSMVSMLEAMCASRLECLAAAHRFQWHSSQWLESDIEHASSGSPKRNDRSSRNLHRSASSATKQSAAHTPRQRPVTMDDFDVSRRTTIDVVEMRRNVNQSFQASPSYHKAEMSRGPLASVGENLHIHDSKALNKSFGGVSSRTFLSSTYVPIEAAMLQHLKAGVNLKHLQLSDKDNSKNLKHLESHYRQGDRILRDTADSMMSCFSRFIRVESRIRGWELRDRAFMLEDDLVQELKAIELHTRGAQVLY